MPPRRPRARRGRRAPGAPTWTPTRATAPGRRCSPGATTRGEARPSLIRRRCGRPHDPVRLTGRMPVALTRPPKARPGDKVAVLSPSFAAPAVAPEVHEQAMRRLPRSPVWSRSSTRPPDGSGRPRATVRRTSTPRSPTPRCGPSWPRSAARTRSRSSRTSTRRCCGRTPSRSSATATTPTCCTGSGPTGSPASTAGRRRCTSGRVPRVDDVHLRSLRAALLTGERLELVEPGESEDVGKDWADPAALDGLRRPGADRAVDLGRPRPLGHRGDVGRLRRGAPVDPHRRAVPAGPRPAARRGAARGDVGGADPGSRARRGSCVRSGSADCSRRSARSSSPGHPCRASTCDRRRASAPPAGPSSATRPSTSCSGTTRTRSSSSACPSVTRGRSGSSRTAGQLTVDGASRRVWADYA